MRKRTTLAQWIREAIGEKVDDHMCSMISLLHMVGQQSKEIHCVKFGATKWNETDLANLFQGKAEAYSQDLVGVQMFQLQAFYGTAIPQSFQPFSINVQQDTSNGLYTEPPDERGRLQMSMRREEMLFQQTYRRQQVQDEYMLRLIEQQGLHTTRLMQENTDSFNIIREMMMQRSVGEHEHEMQQLKFARETEERKKWMSYAPMLINTLLGREVFPQGTADTVLVEAIADSLSIEDIGKLSTALKPELMGPLASRLHQYELKKQADQENRRRLTEITPKNEYDEDENKPKQLPKKKVG